MYSAAPCSLQAEMPADPTTPTRRGTSHGARVGCDLRHQGCPQYAFQCSVYGNGMNPTTHSLPCPQDTGRRRSSTLRIIEEAVLNSQQRRRSSTLQIVGLDGAERRRSSTLRIIEEAELSPEQRRRSSTFMILSFDSHATWVVTEGCGSSSSGDETPRSNARSLWGTVLGA